MNTEHKTNTHQNKDSDRMAAASLSNQLRAEVERTRGGRYAALVNDINSILKENTPQNTNQTGLQPLMAGTQAVQSRNPGGTQPERPAGTAETGGTAGTDSDRKRHPHESPLDQLPEETQDAIIRLIEERSFDAALLEVTTKKPYGMGIQTSRSSLYRFHNRYTTKRNTHEREQLAADAVDIVAEAKTTGKLTPTAAHIIELRLLEAAISPKGDADKILALSRSLERIRSLNFAERRLRLAELKSQPTETVSSQTASP